MTNRSRLMTKPWWTLLFAFKYNCLHSFYNTSREAYASHCHSQGMRTNAFSKYTNAKNRFFSLARYLPCSCLTMKMASVVPLPVAKPNWNSAMSTISHIILSSTLSITFKKRSVIFRLLYSSCIYLWHHPCLCTD